MTAKTCGYDYDEELAKETQKAPWTCVQSRRGPEGYLMGSPRPSHCPGCGVKVST